MHATWPFLLRTSSNREALHSARFSNRCKSLLVNVCSTSWEYWRFPLLAALVLGALGTERGILSTKPGGTYWTCQGLHPRTPLQLNIDSVRHAEQWKVTCQSHATAVPRNSRRQMPAIPLLQREASKLRDLAKLCVTRSA